MIKYLFETLVTDWDNKIITPKYENYNIEHIGYLKYDTKKLECISKVKINNEEKFNNFLTDYVSYIRLATDKEVIDCLRDEKIKQLEFEHKNFICERYPLDKQTSFIAFALARCMTHGFDIQKIMNDIIILRILSVFNWVYQVVMPYFYLKEREILECNNLEEWEQITWNHRQFEASDPDVRLGELMMYLTNNT